MTKYKEYYQRMIEENKDAFEKFTKIHLLYSTDPEKYQALFNKEGKKILEIIREWENRLCQQSEKAGYGTFTNRLSEKFWEEVRRNFPKIDFVGILVEEKKEEPLFFIKKINLN